MSRTVQCVYLKKEAEGLERMPLPGELGERIFNEISQEAWQEWIKHQTMLINEYRLSLIDPKARTFLQDELVKFLFEGGAEKPAEFVAPESE